MRQYKSPMFQHRHYAAIAKVLADTSAPKEQVYAFSALFNRDNPNFDGYRFREAAEGNPITGKDKR